MAIRSAANDQKSIETSPGTASVVLPLRGGPDVPYPFDPTPPGPGSVSLSEAEKSPAPMGGTGHLKQAFRVTCD